jgi:hypothetical protein
MSREPKGADEKTPRNDAHLQKGADRAARQPYASEVEDYAGEKAAPPKETGTSASKPSDISRRKP